jgi:hypothetical protein
MLRNLYALKPKSSSVSPSPIATLCGILDWSENLTIPTPVVSCQNTSYYTKLHLSSLTKSLYSYRNSSHTHIYTFILHVIKTFTSKTTVPLFPSLKQTPPKLHLFLTALPRLNITIRRIYMSYQLSISWRVCWWRYSC